jgi:type IV pilus assembly protein PilC
MSTTFQYTVRDRAGKLVKGTITAESQTIVMQRLKAGGYAPVSITQANSGMKKELSIPGFGKKVKLKDLSIMARQFATMVNSGLSLLRTLTILSEQTTNPELGRVLGLVRNEVETGNALSSALGKHPRVFPPIMINMVRAGEVGGFAQRALPTPAIRSTSCSACASFFPARDSLATTSRRLSTEARSASTRSSANSSSSAAGSG